MEYYRSAIISKQEKIEEMKIQLSHLETVMMEVQVRKYSQGTIGMYAATNSNSYKDSTEGEGWQVHALYDNPHGFNVEGVSAGAGFGGGGRRASISQKSKRRDSIDTQMTDTYNGSVTQQIIGQRSMSMFSANNMSNIQSSLAEKPNLPKNITEIPNSDNLGTSNISNTTNNDNTYPINTSSSKSKERDKVYRPLNEDESVRIANAIREEYEKKMHDFEEQHAAIILSERSEIMRINSEFKERFEELRAEMARDGHITNRLSWGQRSILNTIHKIFPRDIIPGKNHIGVQCDIEPIK